MTWLGAAAAPNLVPGAYRGVAVASVDCGLDEESLVQHFVGREAYRRTRFIVVRNGEETAIVAVEKAVGDALFTPITAVRLLVGPVDCVFVCAADVDTAVPTALARLALDKAPGVRGVVVQGRYSHISFIIDAAPIRVTVREVVPPHPPKLFDQIQRVLDVAEYLPPIELIPDLVDLEQLAACSPSSAYLLPCRGGGVSVDGATTAYLDEHPPQQDWTLIGCERSQQIHEWFYGDRAPQVDICPRKRPGAVGPTVTKCCLLETDIEISDGQVVVPWGASFAQIFEALTALTHAWGPTWAPV